MPLPLPLAPLVIVTQPALLVAVQEQPVGTDTAMEPVTAAASTETPVGVTVAVQVTPAWVTVKVRPAMVTVPVREDVLELAATL